MESVLDPTNQFLEGGVGHRRSGDHDDVLALGETDLVEGGTETALGTIAADGATDAFASHDADATTIVRAVGADDRDTTRSGFVPRREETLEVITSGEGADVAAALGRDALAALLAAPRDGGATLTGAHALAKAHLALAASVVRLIGALHERTPVEAEVRGRAKRRQVTDGWGVLQHANGCPGPHRENKRVPREIIQYTPRFPTCHTVVGRCRREIPYGYCYFGS